MTTTTEKTVGKRDSKRGHFLQPSTMDAISYAAASKNLSATLDRVIDDHEPVIITREESGAVVVMSLDDFNGLQETMYLLQSPANAGHLRASIADLDAGKGIEVTLEDL